MLQGLMAGGAQTGLAQGQESAETTAIVGGIGSILGALATNAPQATTTAGGVAGGSSVGTTAVQAPTQGQSAPEGGQAVGETQTDTSPSLLKSAPMETAQGQQGQQATLQMPTTAPTKAVSIEPSAPGGLRFAADAPTPSGYVRSGPAQNGSYPAAPIARYQQEAERFSRMSGVAPQAIDISSLAIADRTITDAGNLSYVPVQGFKQIALSSSGQPVYAREAALNSTDVGIGERAVSSLGIDLASLNIDDKAVHGAISEAVSMTNASPAELEQVAAEIAQSTDPKAQKVAYGLMRIKELSPHISEAQKSNMVAALTDDIVELKTGKRATELEVPGTQGTVGGALKVKDIIGLEAEGANAKALSKKWDQISVLGAMVGKTNNPKAVYNLGSMAGMTGYGPQGAAVPVDAKQLAQISKPAPEFGVGARVFKDRNKLPEGYREFGYVDGAIIALPEVLGNTTPLGTNIPNELSIRSVSKVGLGSHKAQSLWRPVDTKGVIEGSAGGSAIVSSFTTMLQSNPTLAGGLLAHAYFNNTLGG